MDDGSFTDMSIDLAFTTPLEEEALGATPSLSAKKTLLNTRRSTIFGPGNKITEKD